ncbi:SPAG5 protein, partial [Galbula dea]|nr:SPAG5 protein [Galbula dea]
GDGSSPPYQDTLEGPKSPAPAPPEQGPSELHPTEAGSSEPVGSEAKVTPVPLPKAALDVVSFLLPEKSLNTSSLVESLQHSLPKPTTVAGTSVAPVPTSVSPLPTAVASTSVTPVPTTVASTSVSLQDLQERSMNKSMSDLPCSKDSTAQTDFLLWHYTREQLASLPRAELEGWMESACVIIEALCFRLRNCQESQQLLSSVGPAEQRDALVQTDVTHPKEEEEIYHNLYQELRRKMMVLQQQQGAEQDLLRELELAITGMSAWSKERLLFQDTVDAGLRSLKAEQEALAQEQKQVKALVSRCRSVLERVPGKLRSCLEERDAMRQQADK